MSADREDDAPRSPPGPGNVTGAPEPGGRDDASIGRSRLLRGGPRQWRKLVDTDPAPAVAPRRSIEDPLERLHGKDLYEHLKDLAEKSRDKRAVPPAVVTTGPGEEHVPGLDPLPVTSRDAGIRHPGGDFPADGPVGTGSPPGPDRTPAAGTPLLENTPVAEPLGPSTSPPIPAEDHEWAAPLETATSTAARVVPPSPREGDRWSQQRGEPNATPLGQGRTERPQEDEAFPDDIEFLEERWEESCAEGGEVADVQVGQEALHAAARATPPDGVPEPPPGVDTTSTPRATTPETEQAPIAVPDEETAVLDPSLPAMDDEEAWEHDDPLPEWMEALEETIDENVVAAMVEESHEVAGDLLSFPVEVDALVKDELGMKNEATLSPGGPAVEDGAVAGAQQPWHEEDERPPEENTGEWALDDILSAELDDEASETAKAEEHPAPPLDRAPAGENGGEAPSDASTALEVSPPARSESAVISIEDDGIEDDDDILELSDYLEEDAGSGAPAEMPAATATAPVNGGEASRSPEPGTAAQDGTGEPPPPAGNANSLPGDSAPGDTSFQPPASSCRNDAPTLFGHTDFARINELRDALEEIGLGGEAPVVVDALKPVTTSDAEYVHVQEEVPEIEGDEAEEDDTLSTALGELEGSTGAFSVAPPGWDQTPSNETVRVLAGETEDANKDGLPRDDAVPAATAPEENRPPTPPSRTAPVTSPVSPTDRTAPDDASPPPRPEEAPTRQPVPEHRDTAAATRSQQHRKTAPPPIPAQAGTTANPDGGGQAPPPGTSSPKPWWLPPEVPQGTTPQVSAPIAAAPPRSPGRAAITPGKSAGKGGLFPARATSAASDRATRTTGQPGQERKSAQRTPRVRPSSPEGMPTRAAHARYSTLPDPPASHRPTGKARRVEPWPAGNLPFPVDPGAIPGDSYRTLFDWPETAGPLAPVEDLWGATTTPQWRAAEGQDAVSPMAYFGKTKVDDRRVRPRIMGLTGVVYFRRDGRIATGELGNLSATGVMVRTRTPVPPGSTVPVALELPGLPRPIRLMARVVHVRRVRLASGREVAAMGLFFLQTRGEEHGTLLRYLAQLGI